MLVLGITSVISYTLLASYRGSYTLSVFFCFFLKGICITLIVLMSAWMKKVRDVTGLHPESHRARYERARRKMEQNQTPVLNPYESVFM